MVHCCLSYPWVANAALEVLLRLGCTTFCFVVVIFPLLRKEQSRSRDAIGESIRQLNLPLIVAKGYCL